MGEMFKKIISVLLAENIEFQISRTENCYTIYSSILYNGASVWYVQDNFMMDAPRFYSYKNNYKRGFVFSRHQDYITIITDIIISCK